MGAGQGHVLFLQEEISAICEEAGFRDDLAETDGPPLQLGVFLVGGAKRLSTFLLLCCCCFLVCAGTARGLAQAFFPAAVVFKSVRRAYF